MKKTLIFSLLLFLLGSLSSYAQQKPEPRPKVKAAMQKIAWLAGNWQGEGSMQMPGAKHQFKQQEWISFKANNSVLLIEGLGLTEAGGDTVHQALALISFDEATDTYYMQAVKGDGKVINAEVEVTDNEFSWSFATGATAKVKYIITNKNGQWHENGSYTPDGSQWYPFMSMVLERTE